MNDSCKATFVCVLLVWSAFPAVANAAEEPRGDGVLSLYTYHLQERAEVHYRDGDKIFPDGMKRIESIFRSRDSNSTISIDPRLVELLDRIEDHFQVRQVEVVSGYRSLLFNQELKKSGHTVGNESFHIKGMAADIHLDEITEEAVRDYAQSLRAGGVGFYPSLHMVHVDVGPVRTWGEAAPRKKWVGEKNENVPLTITVGPDRSVGKKELETLQIEGSGGEEVIESTIEIEFFDRDRWVAAGKIDSKTPLHEQKEAFKSLSFGKFRLKVRVKGDPGAFQYSNEFYFKRL